MRPDGTHPLHSDVLQSYFSEVSDPAQIELLGTIAIEILGQNRQITRTTLCLKLIVYLDNAKDEQEVVHLTGLIRLLFRNH